MHLWSIDDTDIGTHTVQFIVRLVDTVLGDIYATTTTPLTFPFEVTIEPRCANFNFLPDWSKALNNDIRYISLQPALKHPFAFEITPPCNLVQSYSFNINGVNYSTLPAWASLDTSSSVPSLDIFDSTTANAGIYSLQIKSTLNTIPLRQASVP